MKGDWVGHFDGVMGYTGATHWSGPPIDEFTTDEAPTSISEGDGFEWPT
ncbi:hypothetical protein [Ponticaulis sp.]|nr:hypothetical protein [Ponticaulis sp.]